MIQTMALSIGFGQFSLGEIAAGALVIFGAFVLFKGMGTSPRDGKGGGGSSSSTPSAPSTPTTPSADTPDNNTPAQ